MKNNKFQKVVKNHPPQEVISQIREELSTPNFPNKNIGLGENATVEEKFKYNFCRSIVRNKVENELSLTEVANRLDLDDDSTNKLLHYHLENFSLENIIDYAKKLQLTFPQELLTVEKSVGKTCALLNINY